MGAGSWSELFAAGTLGPARGLDDGWELSRRGEPADTMWYQASGLLEVHQTTEDGRSYLARILVAPTVLCLKECLAGETTYLQTVRVLEAAEVVAISRARLLEVLAARSELCLSTLVEVSRAFCGAARLESNCMADAERLLAHALLAYTEACGEPWDGGRRLRVKRTQTDLAGAIGANERSVSRVLGAWKRQGWVDRRDGRYLVRDRAALLARAEVETIDLIHHGHA